MEGVGLLVLSLGETLNIKFIFYNIKYFIIKCNILKFFIKHSSSKIGDLIIVGAFIL